MTKKELVKKVLKLQDDFVSMLINHTSNYDLPQALAINKSCSNLVGEIINNLEVKEIPDGK